MPKRTNDQPGTGCRHDCLHRALVENYRDVKILADEHRKIARENVTGGFAAEMAEWDAAHPALTFRQYLIDHARRPKEGTADD